MSKFYPSWLFHKDLPPRIVQNEVEHLNLGPGWFDSPAKANAPQPPTEEAEEVIETPAHAEAEIPVKRGPGRPKKVMNG